MSELSRIDKIMLIKNKLTGKRSMTLISCAILLILLIAATAAWYVLNRTAIGQMDGANVSRWDFVVSTTPDAANPITSDSVIDVFSNSILSNEVADGKLAPGVSGNFKLYISTASEVSSHYVLAIDKAGLKVDFAGNAGAISDASDSGTSQDELTTFLQKHICFYSDSEFKNEITAMTPLEGDVDINGATNAHGIAEKEVTIYWVWHYDGSFLCDGVNDATILSDYDKEDVLICNFRNYITGNIKLSVSGTQKQPVAKG